MAASGGIYSLYDLSLAVITSEFGLINIKLFKGLPSIILQDIICCLNPVDLETVENEEFLALKGITTLAAWKSHCSHRWKHVQGSSSAGTNSQAWRSLYFQQHFYELINKLSRSHDHEHLNILQDSSQALLSTLQEDRERRKLTGRSNALEYMHNVVGLCAKHLHRLRLTNAMCLYLEKHMEILIKLAKFVIHLDIFGLRCTGMNSLSKIIPLMVGNKLTSLTLDCCSFENEATFRNVLLSLCESRCGEVTYATNCAGDTDMTYFGNNSVRGTPNRESVIFSDEIQSKANYSEITDGGISEDDLYDDIFSQNAKLQKIDSTNTDMNSSHISPSFLTTFELNDCLINPNSLKALCETFAHFKNLHTLILRDTGSEYRSEMYELVRSIRYLVHTGSLCYLEVKNLFIDDDQGIMFCDMIVDYCQKCSSHTSKGLRSLNLCGNMVAGTATAACMAQKLTTCSYCGSKHVVGEGLRQLSLQNLVDQNAMKLVVQSVCYNHTLQSLSLPSCWLKMEDIAELLDYISGSVCNKSNNVITKLDLQGNPYLPLTDGRLSNLIKQSELTYLDLSYCGIEVFPDDVILALCSNNILKVLKVAGNRLGDKGVTAITRIFKTNEKKSMLMSLDLSCNRITAPSLLHLGDALQSWPHKLTDISIIGNLLKDSQEEVKTCLKKVFDIVNTKSFDSSMAFVDYLSEM